jgi:hypothetical protein
MRVSKAIGLMMLLVAVATRAGASDYGVRPASGAAPVSSAAPPLLYVPPPVGPAPPAANGVPPVVNGAPPAPAASFDGPPAVAAPDGSGPCGQFYLDANYLVGWIQSGRVPTLVTTTVAGLPRGQAGVEGTAGNVSLFGGSVSGSDRSGGLIRGGYVLDSKCREGIEVGFIAIGRAGDTFNASSNGSRVLARPFFNTATSQSDADLVAFPGLLAGSIHVRTASEVFGGELNYRCALSCLSCGGIGCCGGGCGGCGGGCGCGEKGCLADMGLTVDFLIGYRGVYYKDKVVIDSTTRNLDPTMIVSNRPLVHDSFYSRTAFHGGQAGFEGHYEQNGFFLDGRAMGAIGVAGSRVDVTGFSNVVNGAAVTRSQVGLLAAQTNHGFFQDENLGFVGELGLKVGYRVSANLSLSVGYTLLYLSSVVRSGDLIDKAVNTTQIPPATLTGPNRPALIIQNQDIFAHGVTVGAELRF